MEAGKRIITDIFNRARILEIPFFQRAYVWSEENWERFLDDMVMTSKDRRPYFLGSVIQKQRPTNTGETVGDVRTIVDGQQRLTTLALFFKVLFTSRGEAAVFATTFHTFAGRLILQHNHADIEIFEAILEDRLTPALRETYKESRILKAHDYFEARREALKDVNPIDLIQLIYFVGIDLNDGEDEQQIFDTINSLGVALSTAELLKNHLYGRNDATVFNATWKNVFEGDQESKAYWEQSVTAGRSHRDTTDLFLQSFLAMQDGVGDDVKVDSLFEEYKKHLKTVHDRRRFVAALADSARLFRKHMRPEAVDEELDAKNAMARLNVVLFGLNTTTPIPYVLYLLKTVEDHAERDRMLSLLENYFIRRLVCREPANNYNRVFGGFIRSGLHSYDALVDRLTSATDPGIRMPSDNAFSGAFLTSNLSNSQAKLAMYLLERSVRSDQFHATALSGLAHYTLEHMMPKKWRNHWGVLPEQAARERDEALRKLGNFSLLSSSLNTSIRDADWATKKAGANGKHGLVRYAQGLETLAPDLQLDTWDESTILARGKRLAEQALLVWPYPNAPAAATTVRHESECTVAATAT